MNRAVTAVDGRDFTAVTQYEQRPWGSYTVLDESDTHKHGTYFGEDDIERLDDDYGRASAP